MCNTGANDGSRCALAFLGFRRKGYAVHCIGHGAGLHTGYAHFTTPSNVVLAEDLYSWVYDQLRTYRRDVLWPLHNARRRAPVPEALGPSRSKVVGT